ncbi:hypothetical protein ACFWU5_10580 [Nocardia sp. NPDC058640]|uniref:hypothetical protein n=1 Tax=Nocardia sp. NPDC058640 TaxID=3346571 RepID=UPI003651DC51
MRAETAEGGNRECTSVCRLMLDNCELDRICEFAESITVTAVTISLNITLRPAHLLTFLADTCWRASDLDYLCSGTLTSADILFTAKELMHVGVITPQMGGRPTAFPGRSSDAIHQPSTICELSHLSEITTSPPRRRLLG